MPSARAARGRLLRGAVLLALAGLLAVRSMPRACLNAALVAELKGLGLGQAAARAFQPSARLAACSQTFSAVDHTLTFLPVRVGASPDAGWLPALARYQAAHPSDFFATQALAEAYLQAGNLESAAPVYASIADANALYQLARWELEAGGYERSERYSLLVVALRPAWAEAWYQLAEAQFHLARPAARASYEEVLKQQPPPELAAKVHVRLGSLMAHNGDLDGAEAQFQTALQLNPSNWSAMEQLSRLALARSEPDTACQWAQGAAALAPDDVWVLRLLADVREVASCEP
ncbi:MAG: tetratricopeptide repeat protein [Anaerolineales bacterium]|nr:tetratricopeptide repeat protein [Anaerolineales bacterium]